MLGKQSQNKDLSTSQRAGLAFAGLDEVMRFTLTYDGPLPASGNDKAGAPPSKLATIWAMREHFAPQLENLYRHHPVMMGDGGSAVRAAYGYVRRPIPRNGLEFVSVVRADMGLTCGLAIKFLVNHEPGSVITQTGDLDNRLKTLLDALRLPRDLPQEFKGHQPSTSPFPCLLEDDSMVTAIAITTERWFNAANRAENEVHLELSVKVSAAVGSMFASVFARD